MDSSKALSLTPHGNAWLTHSRCPRVLHVFEYACNLINERREVLSVVTEEIGDGPFNLVIPRLRKSFGRLNELDESRQTSEVFANLNLQSLISNSPNYLNLGDLTIHTDDARLWSPRPDWGMLHARRDDILDHLMSLRVSESERSDPVHEAEIAARRLTMTSRQFAITNYEFLKSPFSNSLVFSLANADLPASLTATQKLAGLGMGLTPAGDDFIMGAVLAAWIIHPFEIASLLAKEITEVAAALTTSLSAAWLRSAGRGEAGILWHQFFEALLTGDSFPSNWKLPNYLLLDVVPEQTR